MVEPLARTNASKSATSSVNPQGDSARSCDNISKLQETPKLPPRQRPSLSMRCELGNNQVGLCVAAPYRYSTHDHCAGRYVDPSEDLTESSPICITRRIVHHERYRGFRTVRHNFVSVEPPSYVTFDMQAAAAQRVVELVRSRADSSWASLFLGG